MVIRYQKRAHAVSLTLPRYVSIRQGLDFVEARRAWLAVQLAEHPANVPFADGKKIPLLGGEYTLKHEGGRGLVRIISSPLKGEGIIIVPGDAVFMARRVREWLKARARDEITPRVEENAARIGRKFKKITLRDTTSLWGSCTSEGHLSFSWRLVMAPPEVLDYMAAHEVAHLAEMNHGARFWSIVETLCPQHETARRWLRTCGPALYGYG